MCSACEDAEITPYQPADRTLVRRARAIEALMPGERVPESAWQIYFDLAGGAIEWRHFQRIRQSYDEAERTVPALKVLGKRGAQGRRVPVCAEIAS
jgi:hypothetical protein